MKMKQVVALHGLGSGFMITAGIQAASGHKAAAGLWMGAAIFTVLSAILIKIR